MERSSHLSFQYFKKKRQQSDELCMAMAMGVGQEDGQGLLGKRQSYMGPQ